MSVNVWIVVAVAALIVAGLILASLKGLVKLLLLAASIIGAFLAYYWLHKFGFSYLSFITDSPSAWMVTAISILGAVLVFAVFQHGLSWFSHMFSWEGKFPGLGGAKGILTTILMGLFIVWLTSVGIFYFGSLSDIRRYKDLPQDPSVRATIPLFSQMKYHLETSRVGEYLIKADPLSDAERLKLAKLVAYLASEKNLARTDACLLELAKYIPHINKVHRLATDKGIQSAMNQNDMGALLNAPKLTRLLADDQIRGGLKTLDADRLFGMSHSSVGK